MQPEPEQILTGHSSSEKAAYLGALASLATADRHADEQELNQLRETAYAAGISDKEAQTVMDAAEDTSGNYLLKCLDVLKSSDLRFSLVTDLIALAKTDGEYSYSERTNIEKVSGYLEIDKDQFSLLDQFVDKASESPTDADSSYKPDLIGATGMQNRLSGAGMDMSSITKGLFGFLGPMILGSLAGRTLGRNRGMPGGGGLGGMLGNNPMGMGRTGGFGGLGGGLGAIIAGMARSRNNQSMGGMLRRILR